MTELLLEMPAGASEVATADAPSPLRRTALMYSYYFPPIASAGVFRMLRFVKYLPDYGWRPIVMTSPPDETTERSDPALLELVPPDTVVEHVPIFHPERWLSRRGKSKPSPAGDSARFLRKTTTDKSRGDRDGQPGIKQILRSVRDLLFFTPDQRVWWLPTAVRAGVRAIRQYDPEVIYTTGPPHSSHLVGLVLRRLTGLPWVADFRDPWSRQPWGMKRSNPWGNRLLPLFEAQCMHYASTVILNTPRMADDFRNFHGSERPSKFVAIPNGFDPDFRNVVDELVRGVEDQGAGGTLRMCHAGSLYARRNADPLLVAVRRLVDEGIDVRFEQFGTCDDAGSLQRRIEELQLQQHVTVEPPIPHREALQRMARSDVLVLIQPGNDLQVPGKLYEMMLFGKPILSLCDDGAVADIVGQYQLGEVARGESPDRIVEAIHGILRQRRNASANLRQNERALEAFDGRYLTRRLAEIYNGLVGQTGVREA